MKKNVRYAALAVAFAAIAATIWLTRTKPEQSKSIALVYQSNRAGNLLPCTCDSNPIGGLDREFNLIQGLRKSGEPTLVVDFGNLLDAPRLIGTIEQAREKAAFMASLVKDMKLDVFAPGPRDYSLGLDSLREAIKTIGAETVSTNLTVRPDGDTIFSPFVVKEVGGVRFVFLSASPEIPGLHWKAPEEALKKWLPEAKAKGDIVILLSQLSTTETQRILKQSPDIQMAIGADDKRFLPDPVWYRDGGKLLLDPGNDGLHVGLLKMQPRLPFRGFYSPTNLEKNIAKKQALEAQLAIPTEAAAAQNALEMLKSYEPVEALQGGTTYENELVPLSPDRFGQENELTKKIKEYQAKNKKSALNEK